MANHSRKTTLGDSTILLWVVAVAFFMQMLDATILNTALPSIAKDLHVSPLRMQSVIIAYILACALLIPASGWLADRHGAKRVFIFAIILFMAGSLLCSLSSSLSFMVFSRVVQGVGGALMVPVGRLAAIRAFPRSELVRVLSVITMPALIGPLLGPTAGGLLVQYATWHWIFLINLPVGAAGVFMAFRFMPAAPGNPRIGKFDGTGFFLFGVSMVIISMAMEGFGELHLPKVYATLMFTAGLCLMILYWIRASHVANPLFHSNLFRVRSFSVGILGNLFSRLGSGAMPFLMPLFLQVAIGFSPLKAGMTMIPAAAFSMAGKSMVTPLVKRFGLRLFLTVNTLILGAMICGFSLIDGQTPYIYIILHLCVFGLINSIQFTVMNSATLIELPDHQTTGGNGLLSVTMQISNSCGVAVAAALLDGFMTQFGASPTRDQMIGVFEQTFFWIGILGVVTSIIFSQLPSGLGRRV